MNEQLPQGIWKFKGPEPGPCLGVLGGVHGNEKTGIEVVKRLRDRFESGDLKLTCGTLYLILGNLEGIEYNQRSSAVDQDLNRMFKKSHLENQPLDFYESRRAHELAPVLRQIDISLDLHATNKPSDPFLCAGHDTPERREIMRFFSADRVIVDPNYILAGEPATTDECVDAAGGIGFCYETGWVKDTSRIDQVMLSVLDVMSAKGMTPARASESPEFNKQVFELTDKVLLTEAGWIFAEGHGLKNFEPFENGTTIGYHGDQPCKTEYDGVIVFPKIPEHWKIGFPVCYLARKLS